MKKIVAALAFLLALGCSGKQYSMTEGPFRGKFARAFSIQYVNKLWSMPIFLNGILPTTPVHIEGYKDNNGAEYYQFHADYPELRARAFVVQNVFSHADYCEATGKPLDRFSAEDNFWNQNDSQGDPSDFLVAPPEDAADGTLVIRFEFFELNENSNRELVPGKRLLQVRTKVKLECPQCDCGGSLR